VMSKSVAINAKRTTSGSLLAVNTGTRLRAAP
jgi:hypothetical protein